MVINTHNALHKLADTARTLQTVADTAHRLAALDGDDFHALLTDAQSASLPARGQEFAATNAATHRFIHYNVPTPGESGSPHAAPTASDAAPPSGAGNGQAAEQDPNANYGFGVKGIPEGLTYHLDEDGTLHIDRDWSSPVQVPWHGKGEYTAFREMNSVLMVPDASGRIDGKAAPGLEGWSELCNTPDGSGHYHGYREYLAVHYPGGYEQWQKDYNMFRRNVLLGETNDLTIASTTGVA